MFKVSCFLLGASAIDKTKDDRQLDLTVVRLLVKDKDGGFIPAEYFYGTANNAKGINALVEKNGAMPVPINADFAFSKSGNGSAVLKLLNFVPT